MQNLCENLRFFGCGYDQGGMADYFTIPANRLHVIPDELDYRAAALIEPMSTPVHAVRIAGDVRDKAVVILGAGTIGLLLLAVVRAHGAKRVVVTDRLPAKRALAARLGADAVLDAADDDIVAQARAALGESADVVFDCVAVTATVRQAVGMASKGGTVVIVGVPADDVSRPATGRSGPPDTHPGQRHLPARGLRRVDPSPCRRRRDASTTSSRLRCRSRAWPTRTRCHPADST